MNDLGTISSYSTYSAYSSPINSVYGTSSISLEKDKQDSSDVQSTQSDPYEINDEAIISDKAKTLYEQDKGNSQAESYGKDNSENPASKEPKTKLTPDQEQEVAKLKARDAEVRTHEQAHMSAAAGISVSAPSYDYQMGPDGKKYAVGGEVSVSFEQGNDPEENIRKAEIMKSAALAPAQPSGQDRAAAQDADKIIAEQEKKLADQKKEDTAETDKSQNQTGETNTTEMPKNTSNNSNTVTNPTQKNSDLTTANTLSPSSLKVY